MNFTKTQVKYLLIAAIVFIGAKSYAGGMPDRPGSLLLSPSVNYFFANKGWDSVRVKKPFSNNGSYSSVTYSLYAEYGISRRFSFVGSLPYVMNDYHQTNYKSLSNGFTDLETGIKYYLANINYIYYFSIQGTAITPLYTNPNLGYAESGAEFKVMFAGSGHAFGKSCFFNLEDGVRQYFGSQGPFQDRYSGVFGLTLDKKFENQISVTVGGFYSSSSFKKFTPNQAVNKNFSFDQVSLSYGHSFSKRFSVFLSGGTFVDGRNTGDGSSVSVSFIIRPF